MSEETIALARRTVDIVPLAMRAIAMELRHGGHALTLGHFRLLGMLAHCPCNLSELARRQGVSLPTMSDSIALLVERGLVRRDPGPRDRRVVNLGLTEAGRLTVNEMQSHLEMRIAALLSGLSPAQMEDLSDGLDVLGVLLSSIHDAEAGEVREEAAPVAL